MKKVLLLLLSLLLLGAGAIACAQKNEADSDPITGGSPQYTTSLGTVISVDADKDIVVLEMDEESLGIVDNPATFDFSGNNSDSQFLSAYLPGVRVEISYETTPSADGVFGASEISFKDLFAPVEYRPVEEVSGFTDALDIEVNDYRSQTFDDNYHYYVFEIENPNQNYTISNCIYRTAGFMDEELVFIDEVVMPTLLPGEKRFVTARVGNGLATNSWIGGFSSGGAIWEETQQQYVQCYDVVNVQAEYLEDHSKILTGEVVLREGVDTAELGDSIDISVVFGQPDGPLAYGMGAVIKNYTAGEPATFEIHCPYYRGYAPYEIYAYPE